MYPQHYCKFQKGFNSTIRGYVCKYTNLIKFYSQINTICVFKVYLKSGFGGHIKRNYFVSLRPNVIQIVRFVPKRNSVTKRPRTVPFYCNLFNRVLHVITVLSTRSINRKYSKPLIILIA